jgi:hypothetical protein
MYKPNQNMDPWAALLGLQGPTKVDSNLEGFTPVDAKYSFDGEAFEGNLKKFKEKFKKKPPAGTQTGGVSSGQKKRLRHATEGMGASATQSQQQAVARFEDRVGSEEPQFFDQLSKIKSIKPQKS